MNIFFLHIDPKQSVKYYFNKHCVKIILEITQMVYAAVTLLHSSDEWKSKHVKELDLEPYRITHFNHPTCKWVRNHHNNYLYACHMGLELCAEYTRRYNKIHACHRRLIWLKDNIPNCVSQDYGSAFLATESLPIGCTPIPLAMPVEYHTNNVIQSYRMYYYHAKRQLSQDENAVKLIFNEWNVTNLPDPKVIDEPPKVIDTFSSMTVVNLKKYCKQYNIKGYSKYTRKKDLIEYIKMQSSIECDICLELESHFRSCNTCKRDICVKCASQLSQCPWCRTSF